MKWEGGKDGGKDGGKEGCEDPLDVTQEGE